jgi:hypothetical protein|tara:strand:- start:262 stop:585 length:324 start_codon:yes stop_codon:yes gene_type:complete
MVPELKSTLELREGKYILNIYNDAIRIGGTGSHDFYDVLDGIGVYTEGMILQSRADNAGVMVIGNVNPVVSKINLEILCELPKTQKVVLGQMVSMHNQIAGHLDRSD